MADRGSRRVGLRLYNAFTWGAVFFVAFFLYIIGSAIQPDLALADSEFLQGLLFAVLGAVAVYAYRDATKWDKVKKDDLVGGASSGR